jgi:hypothetical protein
VQQAGAIELIKGRKQLAQARSPKAPNRAKVHGSTVIEGMMFVLLSS